MSPFASIRPGSAALSGWLILLSLALAPAPVRAATTRASSAQAQASAAAAAQTNTVVAALRFGDGASAELPIYTDVRVTITRNDVPITIEQPLPAQAANSFFVRPKLLVFDMDDDADPEVLVDVYTAGYDCCRRSVMLHFNGTGYTQQVVDWSSGDYVLRNLVGGASPEFTTNDDRFARLFDGDARGPVRVLGYLGGTLTDLSLQVPAQLRRDAKIQARALARARRSPGSDRRPILAAYLADLVRLDQPGQARRVLRAAARRHELGTTPGRFALRIDQRLTAWDYAVPPGQTVLGALRG